MHDVHPTPLSPLFRAQIDFDYQETISPFNGGAYSRGHCQEGITNF